MRSNPRRPPDRRANCNLFALILGATLATLLASTPMRAAAQPAGAAPVASVALVAPAAPSQERILAGAGEPRLLLLAGAVFDPLVERPDFESLGFASARPGRYGIVQWHSATEDASGTLAALGVELVGYLPNHAFQVRWSAESRARLEAHPAVRWLSDYPPGFKVSPALWPGRTLEPDARINVVGFRRADLAEVEASLLAEFPEVRRTSRVSTSPQPQVRFRVPAEVVEAFVRSASQLDEVAWLEPWRLPVLHNSDAVSPIQANASTGTPIWDQDLIGTGQIVAVADSGLDRNQCWFTQYNDGVTTNTEITDAESLVPPATGTLFPQRKVIGYWVAPGASAYDDNQICTSNPTSFHGSHTSGTIVGDRNTVATPTDPGFVNTTDDDGMAPNAQILFQDLGDDATGCLSGTAGDIGLLFEQARDGGARIHSDSWGAPTGGAYSSSAQEADAAAWRLENLLIVFSAGNSGPGSNTIGAPGVAKNVVTVGALGHGNSTTTASFSSRGPTDDTRIKPDIMAPGTSTVSASGDDNDATPSCPTNGRTLSGTSMACPTVAGGAALARQYFADGFYPSGARTTADRRAPSSALLKAVLLNGTRELTTMPSNNDGWGRIFLDNNLYFDGGDRRIRVWSRVHEVGLVQGGTDTYSFVAPAGAELRVTLVWMDPYPALGAAVQLVNNLDLEVDDPGAVTYRGNVFSGGQSATGGSADLRNNVEQVRWTAPGAGTYTVRVTGASIPGNGDPYTHRQGYALVASYGDCSGAVTAAPANVAATDMGATGVEISFDATANATVYNVYRAAGNCSAAADSFDSIGTTTSTSFLDPRAQGGYSYAYKVRAADGCAEGPISTCATATATGSCDLVPDFEPETAVAADQVATPACDVELSWSAGTSNCPLGATVTYNIYRSTQHDFIPGAGNLLAGDLAGTSYLDGAVDSLTTYHYVVRARDSSTPPNEAPNSRKTKAVPTGGGRTVGTFQDGADGAAFLALESPWQLSVQFVSAGSLSYHSGIDFGTYPADVCASITTPPLELIGGGTPTLSYAARWNIESDWDGVVVEISTDGGANWADLPPSGGYPGSFSQTGNPPINACAYPASQGAYSGSSGGVFQTKTSSLAAYAGQTVQIRWRFSSDPGSEELGFFLDAVEITNATTPYPCGALFLDAFESGDVGEWSLSQP